MNRGILRIGLLSVFFIALILILQSCKSYKSFRSQPYTSTSGIKVNALVNISLRAFHLNDTVTRIYYRFDKSNLVFKREDSTGLFHSSVSLFFKALPNINDRRIIDTLTKSIVFRMDEYNREGVISGFADLHIPLIEFAYLEFDLLDRNKSTKYPSSLYIYKSKEEEQQDFLVYNKGGVAFQNYFEPNEQIRIVSNRFKFSNTAKVEWYKGDFSPAMPPFVPQKNVYAHLNPDSVATYEFDDTLHLTLGKYGFYRVSYFKDDGRGLSIHVFGESYPGVTDANEMVYCTRYIMSKEEYNNCLSSANKKESIDNFWLSVAGSNERAKEVLKKYYGRVMEANMLFTSMKEGWKTDRGMIHIIFGDPINIYKSVDEEIWIYGPEADVNSLRFVFKKETSEFSDNIYVLQRSYVFKEPWYTAVDYWRMGRVYLEK